MKILKVFILLALINLSSSFIFKDGERKAIESMEMLEKTLEEVRSTIEITSKNANSLMGALEKTFEKIKFSVEKTTKNTNNLINNINMVIKEEIRSSLEVTTNNINNFIVNINRLVYSIIAVVLFYLIPKTVKPIKLVLAEVRKVS